MFAVQFCALLILLAVCSFVPGFALVRHLRWTPLEKLCGSIGLSVALIYLATWAIFLVGPQDSPTAYRLIAAAILALAVFLRREELRFLRVFRVRQALASYAVLLIGVLLMLSMIRVYSGAGWASDWVEHFQRALFFLHRFPAEQQVLNFGYTIPARPPLMNVVAAFFLGAAGDRHELFQAAFAFLNLLVVFPCFLLLPALVETSRRRYAIPLVALFASSPIVMENVTYTWTKALTAFYIVFALALYLSGLRKGDNVRAVAAFLMLAPAILIHYSAGPYVLFLTAHYLVRFLLRRPKPWRELVFIAISCGLFLMTWFGWSLRTYGAQVTFRSNTAVTLSAPYEGRNMQKIAWNLYASTVPIRLRGDEAPFQLQRNLAAFVRDEAFMLYQLNLIFGMGLVSGPLAVWLAFHALRRSGAWRRRESRFWILMVPVCVLVGIAVVGEKDIVGTPHLTLLAVQIIGITLVAASFPALSGRMRLLVIAGCVLDFSFGVFLHARVQSFENTPERRLFGDIEFADGRLFVRAPNADALTGNVWRNWAAKHEHAAVESQLTQMPELYKHDPSFRQSWPGIEQAFRNVQAGDLKYWGGWFGRNRGVLTYLGDRVAGESGRGADAVSLLFALFFIAVAYSLVRWQL